MNRTTATTIVLVALWCTACGSNSTSTTATGTSAPPTPGSSTTSRAYTGPTIHDGTYRHVLVAADVRHVGFPASAQVRILGKDGHEPITLKIQGNQWTEFETADNGDIGTGDLGTFDYRPGHQVLMTSQSVGCPGCQQLWHWSQHGSAVTLRLLKDTVDPIHDLRDVRDIMEHTFTKVG